ncbi:uncharacterized protein FA14DRAFT_175764 [Meira miltonrushii]|uniref:Uncharacterized protein n=1 Tax=Meira miltonrushii TaxID=1280837 RepID=A0A316VGM3_9BASI|nr:uncharacterized protein FA14DRAFT_175764 [Meira miltonrushii]PWN36434.1 hypothetical protein FA14DRAFT_175764 [Meira miltonrushii]
MIIHGNVVVVVGIVVGITTGLAAYQITTGFRSRKNQCYVAKPIDLTFTATENIQRICHAASIGHAEVQPGKIVVTKHYNALDRVHLGQEVKLVATLSYNDNDSPCKPAGITL